MAEITVQVEFSGGMELLFQNVRKHTVVLPSQKPNSSDPATLQELIFYLRDYVMTDKKDLFVHKETVRPGILVLINDVDWELCNELEYVLKDKDEVVFISTLHGG
ncbi:ubiquitin-related modifier 1 [Spinellus fusiger]|nr:ubiquitin-related modifier 1 [Spinellus fusiger]